MLAGFVPWPSEDVRRWKDAGYREGLRVADIVLDAAARLPDKVAVIEGQRSLTVSELVSKVDRLASALCHVGLKPQDHVAMQLPNSIEFVFAFLALMRLGAIPVMALRAHRYSEIRATLIKSTAAGTFALISA